MATTIASVATIQLPSTSRILPTAWCPDKDLLVVASHPHQGKLTLYKMQGSKKWELTIKPHPSFEKKSDEADVVDVAWSPDGMSSSTPWRLRSVSHPRVQSRALLSHQIRPRSRSTLFRTAKSYAVIVSHYTLKRQSLAYGGSWKRRRWSGTDCLTSSNEARTWSEYLYLPTTIRGLANVLG